MRPYQTLILILLAALIAGYFLLRPESPDPAVERFVDCYVELAILHQMGDTAVAAYDQERDSVLAEFDFTEASFRAFKAQLDTTPEKLVDIWVMIDERLRQRKEALEPTE